MTGIHTTGDAVPQPAGAKRARDRPDLLDAAHIVGRWCWLQARAFEIVGGWVSSEANAGAKIRFFSHSRRMGTHAASFSALLPSIAGSTTKDFVVPSEGDEQLRAELGLATTTTERLAAVYETLTPHEIGEYRSFLAAVSPVGSMPLVRAVAVVLADEEQDLHAGSALLASLRPLGAS